MKLIEMKERYVADLEVANIKLHNLHWNVYGHAFKLVHEYLDDLYEQFFELMDQAAERMRMDGDIAPASLKRFLELTDMKELPDEKIAMGDALEVTHEILQHMRDEAHELRKQCDENDEYMWVALMEDHIEIFDKELWFTKEMIAKK